MKLTAREYSFPDNRLLRQHIDVREGDRHLYWLTPLSGVIVNDFGGSRKFAIGYAEAVGILESTDPEGMFSFSPSNGTEHILIEHTSANPVHPLHLAAFRGSLIGASLARLNTIVGNEVSTAYFVNDLGRQVDWALVALDVADFSCLPPEVRFDRAVGVLYAAANMAGARRSADLKRLQKAHPWLTSVINRELPEGQPALNARNAGSERSSLVSAMIAHAAADLSLIGCEIDRWEFESTLPPVAPQRLLDDIGLRTTTVNGVTCLALPGGLIPIFKVDGAPLYFAKDVLNLLRRQRYNKMLHVIGSEQVFLQQSLQEVARAHGIELEHVPVGSVTFNGIRSSARQDRLQVVHEYRDWLGRTGFRDLCLSLLGVPSRAPIDIGALQNRRIAQIGQAQELSWRSKRVGGAGGQPAKMLTGLLLRAPGLVKSAVDRRAPHVALALAVELASAMVACDRAGGAPAAVREHAERALTMLIEAAVGQELAGTSVSRTLEEGRIET